MPTHLLEFVYDLLQIELLPQLHIIADQIRLVVDEQVEKVPHAHVAERDVTLLRDQERDHVDVVAERLDKAQGVIYITVWHHRTTTIKIKFSCCESFAHIINCLSIKLTPISNNTINHR